MASAKGSPKAAAELLATTMKLAEFEERIRLAAEASVVAYTARTSSIVELNKQLEKFSLKEQISEVQGLTAAVKLLAGAMSDYTGNSDGLDKIAKSLKDSEPPIKPINDGLDKIAKSLKEITDKKTDDGLNEMAKNLKDSGKHSGNFSKEVGGLSSKVGKFASVMGVAGAGLRGLQIGFKNLIALGKSASTTLLSVGRSAFNIAAAFISIPLNIFGNLVKFAGESAGGMDELRLALEAVRKDFGAFWGPVSGTIVKTTMSMNGFNDTGLNTFQIFGTMAERLKSVHELFTGLGATAGLVTEEFKKNGGAVMAYQKALGFSNEEMRGMASLSIVVGKKMGDIFKDMGQQAYDLGKAFAVDSKLIGKDMAKALNDVKHFGGATTKSIGEASVYARKLGLELEKITGTLDAFETFDSAAQNAAKLSQSFGVTVDAFKLMEAQDPGSQLEQLRKQMAAAGQDSSNMNRQQLKLLATTVGLDEATARQAFSLKNQGMSMDEIKKKSGDSAKKQMTQLEVLSKLADNIERLVKSGEAMHGGFFDQFVKGFKDGVFWSQDFQRVLREIRMGLMMVYREGFKLGQYFVKAFPGVTKMLKNLQEIFQPGKFQKFAEAARESLSGLFDGKTGVEGVIERLRAKFTDIFGGDVYDNLRENFQHFAGKLADIAGGALAWAGKQVGAALSYIGDILSGRKKLPGMGGAVDEASSFADRIMAPLIAGLSDAWISIRGPLYDMLHQIKVHIIKFFKSSEFQSAAKTVGTAMIGIIAGPAVTRIAASLGASLLGALGSAVIKSSLPVLIKGIVSALGSAAGPIGAAFAIGLSSIFISQGVKKFAAILPAEMKGTERDFTAGMAGIVDALTLGLLPDKWVVKATLYLKQGFDKVISWMDKNLMGYGSYLKENIMSAFKILEGVGDIIMGFFDDDSKRLTDGIGKMFSGLLRMISNLMVTLPSMLIKGLLLAGKAIVVGGLNVIKIAIGGLATTMEGSIGGTLLKTVYDSLDSVIDVVSSKFNEMSTAITAGTGFIRDIFSSLSSGNFKDALNVKSVSDRIAELTKKGVEAGVKKGASEAKPVQGISESLDFSKNPEAFIEKTADVIARAEDAKKSLESFDVKPIQAAFDKLKSISIGGLEGTVVPTIEAGLKVIKDIGDTVASSSAALNSIGDMSGLVQKITGPDGIVATIEKVSAAFSPDILSASIANMSNLKGYAEQISGGITKDLVGAINVLTDIVKAANNLETALSDSKLNSMKVSTKLQAVAGATKLGSSNRYTIDNKAVQINLQLNVSMNVDEIEEVMVLRKESLIRDRINFFSDKGRTKESRLPDSRNAAHALVSDGSGPTS